MIDFKKLQEKIDNEKDIFYILVSGDKDFQEDTYHTVIRNKMVASLSAKEIVEEVLNKVVSKVNETCEVVNLVTGDNYGTDSLVVSYATEKDLDVLIYQAHWEELGSKAGYDRNEEMFQKVSLKNHKRSIIFWDGLKPYTLNLIYQAFVFGVKCNVYDYKAKRWLTSSELNEIQLSESYRQHNSRKRK